MAAAIIDAPMIAGYVGSVCGKRKFSNMLMSACSSSGEAIGAHSCNRCGLSDHVLMKVDAALYWRPADGVWLCCHILVHQSAGLAKAAPGVFSQNDCVCGVICCLTCEVSLQKVILG